MSAGSKAVFLSYASQDAAAASRLCEGLRAAGIEAWFDQEGLTGGDVWDRRIREQIRDCALFIPVISAATEQRLEGYFRREWRLAADRALDMADGRPFLLPVVLDGTAEHDAQVPEAFLRVQWTRLPGGQVTPALLERLRGLLKRTAGADRAAAAPAGGVVAASAASPGRRRRRGWLALAAIAVLLLAGYGVIRHVLQTPPATSGVTAGGKSIAVLPFTDMSEKKDQEYFSDGMAEEILDLLVKVPELKVIARTSSFQFKGRADDVRHIGQQLGASFVLEGSVRRSTDRVRVTAQLIRTSDGSHVWSQSYERPVSDVLEMQQDLATGIARALQVTLDADEWSHLRPTNAAAYEHYLRARLEVDRWTPEGWENAIADLQQSLAIDPQFASASSSLGAVYEVLADYGYGGGQPLFGKAKEYAQRALDLDPRNAMANAILADVAAMTDHDWALAHTYITRARELEPGNAVVLTIAAKLDVLMGRGQEALIIINRAIELDPLMPAVSQIAEYAYSCDNRFPEAETAIRRSLRISPQLDGAHFELAALLIVQGHAADAMAVAQAESNDIERAEAVALVHDALGDHAAAEAELNAIQGMGDSDRAIFYALRGDRDRAFALIEAAFKNGGPRDDTNLPYLKCHAAWFKLRSDARFGGILGYLKLPP